MFIVISTNIGGSRSRAKYIGQFLGYDAARKCMLEAFKKSYIQCNHNSLNWKEISSRESYNEFTWGFDKFSAFTMGESFAIGAGAVTVWQILEFPLAEETLRTLYLQTKEHYDIEDATAAFKEYIEYDANRENEEWRKAFTNKHGFTPEEAMDEDSAHFLLEDIAECVADRISSFTFDNGIWAEKVGDVLAENEVQHEPVEDRTKIPEHNAQRFPAELLPLFDTAEGRKKLTQLFDKRIFSGKNADDEEVLVGIRADVGITKRTKQNNGWIQVLCYDTEGYLVEELFDGRWNTPVTKEPVPEEKTQKSLKEIRKEERQKRKKMSYPDNLFADLLGYDCVQFDLCSGDPDFQEALEWSISTLADKKQEIVYCKYRDKLSIKKIAEKIDESEAFVRSTLYYSAKTLKDTYRYRAYQFGMAAFREEFPAFGEEGFTERWRLRTEAMSHPMFNATGWYHVTAKDLGVALPTYTYLLKAGMINAWNLQHYVKTKAFETLQDEQIRADILDAVSFMENNPKGGAKL